MKRIFSAFLALLCLLSAFVLPTSAKSLSDAIYEELLQIIKVEDYLPDGKDSGIYFLQMVETGYGEKGFENGGALYLYFFNPSRKVITDSVLNTITMATKWGSDGEPLDYVKYPLLVEGTAADGLFFRAKVNKTAQSLATVKDGKRKYAVSEVEFYEGGYNATARDVGYTYEFSGYGDTLTCTKQDFLTLEIDVHQVNYISPTEEEGRYNQINSVYFTIPKEVEDKFGNLYSVSYEYYQARTKPIIFTDDTYLYNRLSDFVSGNDLLSDLLIAKNLFPTVDSNFHVQYFVCSGFVGNVNSHFTNLRNISFVSDFELGFEFLYSEVLTIKKYLPVYLSSSYNSPGMVVKVSVVEPDEIIMSAGDLQKEIKDYSELHSVSSDDLIRDKYLKSLFQVLGDDRYTGFYYTKYESFEKNRDELFDVTEGVDRNWWETLWNLKDPTETETYAYIQPVGYYDTQRENFSSQFLVNDIYTNEIAAACDDAGDDSVYLLRYAVSDNYLSTNFVVSQVERDETASSQYEAVNLLGYDDKEYYEKSESLFAVEQNVYLDFDIIKFTFGSDATQLKTIGVVSSPTDGFADAYSPPGDDNPIEWKKIFALILGVVALITLVWVVGKVISVVNSTRQASAYGEMRKFYKKQNKYNRRR